MTSEETGNGSSRNSSRATEFEFLEGNKKNKHESILEKKTFLLIVLVVAILFIAGTYILLYTYIGKGYIVYMWITHTPLSLFLSLMQSVVKARLTHRGWCIWFMAPGIVKMEWKKYSGERRMNKNLLKSSKSEWEQCVCVCNGGWKEYFPFALYILAVTRWLDV